MAMASFAEGYHRHKMSGVALATVSFLNSGKYTVNPEMRAKMIVDVTQKTNMDFCKAFWSLTEGYGIQVCYAAKVIIVAKCNTEPKCNNSCCCKYMYSLILRQSENQATASRNTDAKCKTITKFNESDMDAKCNTSQYVKVLLKSEVFSKNVHGMCILHTGYWCRWSGATDGVRTEK